jgi:hypothetical protein
LWLLAHRWSFDAVLEGLVAGAVARVGANNLVWVGRLVTHKRAGLLIDGEAGRSEPAVGPGPQLPAVPFRRAAEKRALVTEMCYNGWAIYPQSVPYYSEVTFP